VSEVTAAHQHGLAESDQELAGAGAPAALLERGDGVNRGIQALDQPGPADQFTGEKQPGEGGEGRIVGADIHPGCG